MPRSPVDFQKANFLLEDVREALTLEMQRLAEEAAYRLLDEMEQEEGVQYDHEFRSTSHGALSHAGNDASASLSDLKKAADLHKAAAAMARQKKYVGAEKLHTSAQSKLDARLKQRGG